MQRNLMPFRNVIKMDFYKNLIRLAFGWYKFIYLNLPMCKVGWVEKLAFAFKRQNIRQ